MATRNKHAQDTPLPRHVALPEQTEPSVDMFIVHEETTEGEVSTPLPKWPQDISPKPSHEADHEYYNIFLWNKVSEFATRIAHEFNSPLGTILVYTQLLLARGNLDESGRECLENIYRETQHASTVSTELISFACRGKPEKSLISIQEVIQRSLELLIPRLREGNIEVVVKLQPDMPKIMADPYQMQKVFTNIIANAEQAMTEGHGRGRLYIKAQVVGEIIRITFDDDGPGIKPRDIKKIFDPFFSTRQAGLGLGLTISSNIVECHGGCIYAENRLEKGATFIVELPIVS